MCCVCVHALLSVLFWSSPPCLVPGGLHHTNCSGGTLHHSDCSCGSLPHTLHCVDCSCHSIQCALHHVDCSWGSLHCALHHVDCSCGSLHCTFHHAVTVVLSSCSSSCRLPVVLSIMLFTVLTVPVVLSIAFFIMLAISVVLSIMLLLQFALVKTVDEEDIAAVMSGFSLLHLVSKSQPGALSPRRRSSGVSGTKKTQVQNFSQEDLKKRLTPLQFRVTQEKGTESAFSGEFNHHKDEGTYACIVCGAPLFSSNAKFNSGSGWPSFSDLMKEDSITESDDFSIGIHRLEVACSKCGAHLGHLFDDGPKPTGSRYCINSASLSFQHKQKVSVSSSSEAEESPAACSSETDEKSGL